MGWGSGLLEQAVEFTQPVATPVDEDDVDVVEQAVEDRGGQNLVIREDLGPVPDVLIEVPRMGNANMQRVITRRGSQPKPGWRIRCTQGYLSREWGFGGWGRE